MFRIIVNRDTLSVITICILLLIAINGEMGIRAQESEELSEPCEFSALAQFLDSNRSALQGRNIETALSTTIEFRNLASSLIQQCSEFRFTSAENGLSKVVGPVNLPDNVYRVAAEFMDGLEVVIEPLAGKCQITGARNVLFGRQGESVAEQIFTAEGCSFLMDIEANGDYSFIFEPILLAQ